MTAVAFTPKSGFKDPDALGTVFVNDQTEVNVREAVASGDALGPKGYIVTEDPAIIRVLDHYEPLKRSEVPEEKPKAASGKSDGGK